MPFSDSIPSPADLVQQARNFQTELFGDNLEGSWMCSGNGDPGSGFDWTGRAAAKILDGLPAYITINDGYPPNLYYSPYRYSGGGNARRDDLFVEAVAVVVDDVGDQADFDEAERRYRAAQHVYREGPLAAWKALPAVTRGPKPIAPKWAGVKIARETLLARIGPPTISLETSPGNCQWTYVLVEPCRDKGKLRSILMAIGSDAKDLARVMRSPGGANWKASALVLGKPFVCRLHPEGRGVRYSIDDMLAAVGAGVQPEVERPRAAPGAEEKPEFAALRAAGLLLGSAETANPDTLGSFWMTCPGHLGDESDGGWPGAEVGHSAGMDAGRARVWPHGGFKCWHASCGERSFDDLCAWVARHGDCGPILERLQGEAARAAFSSPVPDMGIGHEGGGVGEEDDDDPVGRSPPREIRIRPGEMEFQVCQVTRALRAWLPVYYYGRRTVEVRRLTERDGLGGKVAAAQIVRLGDSTDAQKIIEGQVAWARYDGRAQDWVRCNMPPRVAVNICNSRTLDLEEITGLVKAPFMRRDGTIGGMREGYDRATGLWVDWAGVTYRPVLDAECTLEGARAALERVKKPLAEYRFAETVGQAVALAAMLTPVARPGMALVPMFAIDAPIQGSGKTKLALSICALMTGLAPALVQGTNDSKELDKRINGALLLGEQCVVVDNLVGKGWGSSDLCAAVTAERINLRPLGTSELVSIKNTFIVFLTGNNLVIEGDAVRRVLVIRIDPDVDRPERARHSFDPVDYVREHRVGLIHDLLVILRAYVLAGRPAQNGHEIGSFGDWARLVRDALLWLGEPDVAESIDLSSASNTPELEALLPAWEAAFGEGRHHARKAADLLGLELNVDAKLKKFGECLLEHVFPARVKVVNPAKWVGAWLGARRDQRAGGIKLQRRIRHGTTLWYVERVTPLAQDDDDDNPVD